MLLSLYLNKEFYLYVIFQYFLYLLLQIKTRTILLCYLRLLRNYDWRPFPVLLDRDYSLVYQPIGHRTISNKSQAFSRNKSRGPLVHLVSAARLQQSPP